jgi:hypothetical protein
VNLIWHLLYRVYRALSGARYWFARRFTRAGFAVAAGVLITAMLGLDTESSVAYQAFSFLLSLLLVAFAFSLFFRARFAATRLLPRFGTAGSRFQYRIVIENLTRKPQRGLTLLERLADPRPSMADWKAVQLDDQKYVRPFRISQRRQSSPFKVATLKEAAVPPMLSNETAEALVEITPLKRGVLRFDGVTLARPDPLGLFRSFVRVRQPQDVLILPKRYPLPPMALPGAMKYQQGGVALAANIGRSDEFVSLRDYRRGDPWKHIHWRSWAKTGKPIIKEFEDEFFVRHALVLDTFTDRPHSDIFEEAVSVAASFACTVATQESLLDLLFVGPQAYCFTAGRGLAHADQMLEVLASVRPCPDKSVDTLEDLVLDHATSVSGCICVLLAWDEARQTLTRKLKALGVPLLVFVITEPGESLDPGPMRDQPGEFRVLEAGRVEQGLAKL